MVKKTLASRRSGGMLKGENGPPPRRSSQSGAPRGRKKRHPTLPAREKQTPRRGSKSSEGAETRASTGPKRSGGRGGRRGAGS